MKTLHEKVRSDSHTSVAFLHMRQERGIPFEWHRHPEFELTLTLNSRGQRSVGDHVEPYDDGDLVLLGPNLPHAWRSSSALDPQSPHVSISHWFSEGWASDLLRCAPEWASIRQLLREASRGVCFSASAAAAVRPKLQRLAEATAADRLFGLLQVLHELSLDAARRTLVAAEAEAPASAPDPRLQRVLNHLHAHVAQRLEIERLAELACLSPSALHRLFLRHTRMSPIAYQVQLRVTRACQLLVEGNQAIGAIAASVGYGNLANFNRQFKASKGVTPREYRLLHRDKRRATERQVPGNLRWSDRGAVRELVALAEAD